MHGIIFTILMSKAYVGFPYCIQVQWPCIQETLLAAIYSLKAWQRLYSQVWCNKYTGRLLALMYTYSRYHEIYSSGIPQLFLEHFLAEDMNQAKKSTYKTVCLNRTCTHEAVTTRCYFIPISIFPFIPPMRILWRSLYTQLSVQPRWNDTYQHYGMRSVRRIRCLRVDTAVQYVYIDWEI